MPNHIPDNVQHLWLSRADAGVTGDPDTNRAYTALIDEAYRITDDFVGAVAALADERTAVVVASDHGFVPGHAELPIVDLFAAAGLLAWQDEVDGMDRQTVAETPGRRTDADDPFAGGKRQQAAAEAGVAGIDAGQVVEGRGDVDQLDQRRAHAALGLCPRPRGLEQERHADQGVLERVRVFSTKS